MQQGKGRRPVAGANGGAGEPRPARTVGEEVSGRARARRAKGASRAPLVAAGVALGLIAVAYLGGVFLFSAVLYPNTNVAGVDVSLMGADTAAGRVEAATAGYKLTLTGGDFTWEYAPDDADAVVDAGGRVRDLLDANDPFAWPVRLAQALSSGTDGSVGTVYRDVATGSALPATFDAEAFSSELSSAVASYNEGRSGTFDAASALDPGTGEFSVDRAWANTRLDADAVVKAATEALERLETDVKLPDDCYGELASGASDDDLRAACDAANALVSHTVTLTMAGTEVDKLDAAALATYVSFGEDLAPSMDTDALAERLRQLTVDKLDTVGTERTYTREDGKSVTVSGGTYGWNVDSASLAQQVADALAAGKDATIEVPTSSTAERFTKRGERDWGAYVDIDLTEQHARYYDASGALKWESGAITGNPNEGNDTPEGVYRMNPLMRDITLIGKTDPATGEPIYRTPVSYWMPFVGGAIGLHDASWQSSASFSDATAYQRVGSHGCVNLPPDAAAALFGIVKEGDCVIVHR